MNINILKRINKTIFYNLFENNNILELALFADKKRILMQDNSKVVTFVIDRNINYTNICTCGCKFCAFYKGINDSGSYVLDYAIIKNKILELIEVGGTQLLLQGGLNPELPLTYYIDLISNIRKDFPALTIHSFSPPEIDFISKNNKISVEELLQEMIKAGLSSIPGGGAELLTDTVRSKISPNKINSARWLEIMEIAHNQGLKTTATMVFGFREKPSDIFEHLFKIRNLQDKTGGFTAFIPWSFQSFNTELGNCFSFQTTSYEYLRVLSVSRLVLDNIANIQASWVTQGLDIAQLSLNFGANDFGGTMLEENVVKAAGTCYSATIKDIIANIRSAGFIPAQRDTNYNIIKLFD